MHKTVTTVLPVSRVEYLDRVLDSLKNQTIPIDNLLVVRSPDISESYLKDKLHGFNARIILVDNEKSNSIPERRQNISNIHNCIKGMIDTDLVFSVEDDGILPPNALESLLIDGAGVVTGVELGRWSTPYVGAWTVDDVNDVTKVKSLVNLSTIGGMQKIDASGLYCAVIDASIYKSHHFFCYNGLGPDINLGIYARTLGYENYINWGVHVTHVTSKKGVEIQIPATSDSVSIVMSKIEQGWEITAALT